MRADLSPQINGTLENEARSTLIIGPGGRTSRRALGGHEMSRQFEGKIMDRGRTPQFRHTGSRARPIPCQMT